MYCLISYISNDYHSIMQEHLAYVSSEDYHCTILSQDYCTCMMIKGIIA
jgi:hypothetical protein